MSLMLGIILCFSSAIVSCTVEVLNYSFTTPESPCRFIQRCLTLQEFSENANQHFRNTTFLNLEFLPGNHELSSAVLVHGATHLKLYSQIENTSILCSHHAHFIFRNVSIVELTYITFCGCGKDNYTHLNISSRAVILVDSQNLIISKCIFSNLKGRVILLSIAISQFLRVNLPTL